jgi:hypothetical protein
VGPRLPFLVLVDAGPEVQTEGANRIADFVMTETELDSVDEFVERARSFNPSRDPRLLRISLLNNLRRLPSGKWTWKYDTRHLSPASFAALTAELRGLRGVMPLIRCPTLVVRGAASDVFTDEDAARAAGLLASGRWVRIDQAGHNVQGDNPQALAKEIRQFMRVWRTDPTLRQDKNRGRRRFATASSSKEDFMVSGSWARYAPLAGLVFVVLVIVSIIVGGFDSVDTNDSTAKVVDFWKDNDSQQAISALIGALALVPFLWFLGVLRSVLRVAEGGAGRLSATAFAGGIVLVAFAAANNAIQFAAAESVGDVPPLVTQTLSTLYNDFFVGFPVGVGTLFLATALVILRTRVLAAWLGWTALIIGIASFAGPAGFGAFIVSLVWTAIVSVVLYQQQPPTVPAPATATPGLT